jgi:hypothetical protein
MGLAGMNGRVGGRADLVEILDIFDVEIDIERWSGRGT